MQNITELPDDIWDLIWDFKSSMELSERLRSLFCELYFYGFLHRKPQFLDSICWTVRVFY